MLQGKLKERVAKKSLSLKKVKKKESGCEKNGSSANISMYFRKKETLDNSKNQTQSASLREPGEQPLAKRQRNDIIIQENNKTCIAELSSVGTSKQTSEFLNNTVEEFSDFVGDNSNTSLTRNKLSSSKFTSIKSSQPIIPDSSNLDSSNQCANENELQCPQLVNGVEAPAMALSNHCMDVLDDLIIPPTPSPVHTSLNNKRISVPVCMIDKANQIPGKRNYKHIKKQNINLSHSKIVAKKMQGSKNGESLNSTESVKMNLSVNNDCKTDYDLKSVPRSFADEKSEKVADVKSISNSSFKLARKTYKLSKKGKKAEKEKSFATPLSNKSEPDGCKISDDVERTERDMLLGYGILTQGNTILENGKDVARINDLRNREITKTKTRRKLSLDRDKNSKLRFEIVQEKAEKEQEIIMDENHETINLCNAQDKMIELEKVFPETAIQNDQDMLDFSIDSDNDEIFQLVDDVSCATKDVKKSIKNLVSPAKQYVRSEFVELSSLVGNFSVHGTEASSFSNADSTKLVYRRFIVLEEYRREYLANVKAKQVKIEKVLRLFDEAENFETYCQLRGEWEDTEVEPGDIVNIVGKPSSSGSYTLDNEQESYIIVYPDILITPTSISTATKCVRRSVLDKHFKTEGQKEVMFLGTLLHRIFEASLLAKDFSAPFVLNHAKQLLQQPPNLTELYGLGITESYALTKVSEFTAFLTEWGKKYFVAEPHPIHGVIDFKDGSMPKNGDDSQVALCVSQVHDIEEHVWSPTFGLKGQIDSCVEVKINRKPNIMKKAPTLNQTCVLPLELKTGKLYSKLGSVEHRAQVILYSLMMMERYDNTIDCGLLLYLKAAHMLGVPACYNEKRALIMKRNKLTRFLSHASNRPVQSMPAMVQNERSCKYCPQLNVCTLYHKSVENGDRDSAKMGKLFDEATSHLTALHLKYFSHWNELIALESKAMQESRDDADIWCLSGTEREDLGYCFSQMSLVSSCVSDEPGRYLNTFKKDEFRSSKVCSADMHLVKGDYVVVSKEDGVLALATGFLKEISEEIVSVLMDKDLSQSYQHRSCCETQRILYRIDKAEISSGATIQWSNLAKLFFADSEEHAKLRRLIVDLKPPTFSHENAMISSTSSSQVSGVWSSQLSSCSMISPVKSSQGNSEMSAILQDLNSDQRKAIEKVLTAQDYALILGCPGAGKTHTIACLVRTLVSLGKSVLLTSYTHSAVDNILLKLTLNQVDFLRLGTVQKVHPDIQPFVAFNATKHINTVEDLKEFYASKSVVATTCLSVNHAIFNQRSFDYCIVDEASQITQPVCIGSLRHASIFVLVGDHYQLPPLVQSHQARDGGMDISLFKRLSECHPQAVVQLEYQYRMHKHIMLLSNTLIYENRLKCGTSEIAETLLDLPMLETLRRDVVRMDQERQAQFTWLLQALDPQFPVLFVDTDLVPAPEARSGHNVHNEYEAALVASIVHGLIKCGLPSDVIGVISPYRQQLKVIEQHLNVEHGRSSEAQLNVEINTVDKYQGRDKLCVVVSLVRSNAGGFVGDLLKDWRRVNVALTRAKRKLILLGSRQTLIHNVLFQELLAVLEENSWIYSLPKSGWRGLLPW